MLHRRRIGLVALLAAALAAVFVWGGEDEGDLSARDRSRLAGGGSVADAEAQTRLGHSRHGGSAKSPYADREVPGDADSKREAALGAVVEFDRSKSDAAESDRPLAEEATPIALHALRGIREAPAVSLVGFDPLGPRELVAWRVRNGRFAILARGHSDRDGVLQFPDLVAARDGLEIVVTAVGGAPGLPGASEARRWAARDPLAPEARLLTSDASAHHIRIAPREASGEVLLADSYGVVLARYPVISSPVDSSRTFDVALRAGAADTDLFLAHEFSDGRASDWEVLTLPALEHDERESE